MVKKQDTVPTDVLLFVDKFMQLLGDAILRIRSLKHDGFEKDSKLPDGIHAHK